MILEHLMAESFRDGFLTGAAITAIFCAFVFIVTKEISRDKDGNK